MLNRIFGITPLELFVAAEQGELRTVKKYLQQSNSEVDVPTLGGTTALMLAAGKDHTSVMGVLIQAGANVNVKNHQGRTALHFAGGENNDSEAVKKLLNAGALLNVGDKDGLTTLMLAAYNGNCRVIDFLILKADLNLKSATGYTALMYAIHSPSCNKSTVIDKLIQAGANVNLANNVGYTALMMAAAKNMESVVRSLIAAGAALDTIDNDGNTSLIWAVKKNSEIARILIEAGANINLVNKNGESAITLAKDPVIKKILDNIPEKKLKEFWDSRDGHLIGNVSEDTKKESAQKLVDLSLISIASDIDFIEGNLNYVKELSTLPTILLRVSNLISAIGMGFEEKARNELDKTSHQLGKVASLMHQDTARQIVQNFKPQELTSPKKVEEKSSLGHDSKDAEVTPSGLAKLSICSSFSSLTTNATKMSPIQSRSRGVIRSPKK